MGQDPPPGTPLMQEGRIRLRVSTGEAVTTVPDLVGLDIASARAQLLAHGLLVSEFTVSDDTAAGTVLSQDPPRGSSVAVGWEVTVYISSGPEQALPD